MASVRDSFGSVQPFLIGVGVPVILGMLGYTVPLIYQQGALIAKLETKLDYMKVDLDKLATTEHADFEKLASSERADFDKLTASEQSSFGRLVNKLDLVNERLRVSETDPNKLIAGVLGPGADLQSASFAVVKGKVVIFPKTDRAASRFTSSGFKLITVAPNISGYVLQSPSAPVGVQEYPNDMPEPR